MHKRSNAFTLIEVLSSLVLLSILVACIMPSWSRIRLAQERIQENALALEQILYLPNADVLELLHNGSAISKDERYTIKAYACAENNTAFTDSSSTNNSLPKINTLISQHSLWVDLQVYAHTENTNTETAPVLAQCTRLLYLPAQADSDFPAAGSNTAKDNPRGEP